MTNRKNLHTRDAERPVISQTTLDEFALFFCLDAAVMRMSCSNGGRWQRRSRRRTDCRERLRGARAGPAARSGLAARSLAGSGCAVGRCHGSSCHGRGASVSPPGVRNLQRSRPASRRAFSWPRPNAWSRLMRWTSRPMPLSPAGFGESRSRGCCQISLTSQGECEMTWVSFAPQPKT